MRPVQPSQQNAVEASFQRANEQDRLDSMLIKASDVDKQEVNLQLGVSQDDSSMLVVNEEEMKEDGSVPAQINKDSNNDLIVHKQRNRQQLDSEPIKMIGENIHCQQEQYRSVPSGRGDSKIESIAKQIAQFERNERNSLNLPRQEDRRQAKANLSRKAADPDHYYSSEYQGPGYEDQAELSY